MLQDNEIPLASTAVRELRVALSNLFLYSADNAMVGQSLDRFLKSMEPLFESRAEISLGVTEGRLVVEGTALNEHLTGSTNMLRDLFQSHGLHTLTLKRGLESSEFAAFVQFLRPHALAPGATLAQALQDKPLPHLSVNLKVFVAMGEGQAAGLGTGSDDGEFSAAMEALQYFLQVFSRVKPDSNRREIARLAGEQLQGWIPGSGGGEGGAGSGSGSGTGSGSDPGGGTPGLGQVLSSVESLKKMLSSVKLPPGAESETKDFGAALTRLVSALSRQVETPGADMAPAAEEAGGQEALFEADPILASLESGNLKILKNPRTEDKVAQILVDLQNNPRMEIMETLWEGIWQVVQDPDEGIQALGLRHLNRWKWEIMPRHLQVEGLRNLGTYLVRCAGPVPYQIAMLLAYGWTSKEWKKPDWPTFNGFLRALSTLDHMPTEAFPEQRSKAHLALQGLWHPEALELLLKRSFGPPEEARGAVETWAALGSTAAQFLLEKAFASSSDEPAAAQALWILERLEFAGVDLLEEWLGDGAKPARLGTFLGVFKKMIMTAGVARRLRAWWDLMDASERKGTLEAAAHWGRKEFRDTVLKLIASGNAGEALEGLRVFPDLAQEGDSRELLNAVESRDYPQKQDRDHFNQETCRALGRMADPLAIPILEDWVHPKTLIDKFKDKSKEVKKAALQALGQYRSQQVRSFLDKYVEGGDKDLRPDAVAALKAVTDRLAVP